MGNLADKEITEKVIGCAFAVHKNSGLAFWKRCMKMPWYWNWSRRDYKQNSKYRSTCTMTMYGLANILLIY